MIRILFRNINVTSFLYNPRKDLLCVESDDKARNSSSSSSVNRLNISRVFFFDQRHEPNFFCREKFNLLGVKRSINRVMIRTCEVGVGLKASVKLKSSVRLKASVRLKLI